MDNHNHQTLELAGLGIFIGILSLAIIKLVDTPNIGVSIAIAIALGSGIGAGYAQLRKSQ